MADLGEALDVLRERFGHADFRAGQAEIVSAILDGDDVLAVLPTGSGKSLLYQLPALLKPSLTLVVSPLVSLMRDQVQALVALGIPAAALHSAAEPHEIGEVLVAAAQRAVEAPLCRAGTPGSARDDRGAARGAAPMSWRSTRPIASPIGDTNSAPTIAACAKPPMRSASGRSLRSPQPPRRRRARKSSQSLFRAPPRVFAGSFARPNLSHRVERRRAGLRQIERFLAEHAGQSGIIYCASREKTDRLARQLREHGYNALAYHAGLDGGTRHAHQDEFVSDTGVVMVATIAFGMGIDKADVRFICHADLPSSMEAYYQETGRAGRDGLPSETLLLYAPQELEARRLQLAGIADPDRQHETATKLDLLDAILPRTLMP